MNIRIHTLLAALLLCGCNAVAADYPSKPIRLVVPFPAGGPVDITARTLAPRLGDALGQRILIDNRGGAGGVLGSDIVAKSPADGHTLLLCTTGNAINVSLVPNLPYDIRKDFAPVSMVAIITSILVVHPSLPVKSVKDLIALAKAKPDALSYASTGSA
jgi:tripartite-type tricarboxylate transporter receptor subunit TctC